MVLGTSGTAALQDCCIHKLAGWDLTLKPRDQVLVTALLPLDCLLVVSYAKINTIRPILNQIPLFDCCETDLEG